ncbi:MAG: ABC transporter ATP-binding protein [Roseburia inulinivorans]
MIIMQDVRKKYGDYEFRMSMEIPHGRITGLVGKNGAGKSTAIKLMLGLAKPDSGSISVLGSEGRELSPAVKQKIGVSLAESGFSTQLTVEDVKHILSKMYPAFEQNLFEKQCGRLKLPTNKKIKEFSTGMKAKLRVLTAITHKAELLILDEPTAGLDVEARNEILDLLREYVAENEKRTILISSHIATDLESLCDDIYLIHDGKLILHEDTDVILAQYGVLKVNEEQYATLDQRAILKVQKENYGYACFTNDRQFYQENYPQIAVENGGIDELILMMTGGYR